MKDRAGVIGVESVQEHEDGSATYKLHMDDKAQAMLVEEGMKFILHCAAAKMDIGDVYDWILSHVPQEEELCPSCREPYDHPSGDGCAIMTKHSIREFDESERKRALERNNKNKSS